MYKTNFNLFFRVAMMTVVLLLSASCDDEYITDWSPVNVYLEISDNNGNDLLDPDNADNIIDDITLSFKGKTYKASREWIETGSQSTLTQTKAYLAQLYGLYLIEGGIEWAGIKEGFALYFGEIDGAEDMDEDLVVTLPDNATHTIHYHCSQHKLGRHPKCKRTWSVDGKETDGNIFPMTYSK